MTKPHAQRTTIMARFYTKYTKCIKYTKYTDCIKYTDYTNCMRHAQDRGCDCRCWRVADVRVAATAVSTDLGDQRPGGKTRESAQQSPEGDPPPTNVSTLHCYCQCPAVTPPQTCLKCCCCTENSQHPPWLKRFAPGCDVTCFWISQDLRPGCVVPHLEVTLITELKNTKRIIFLDIFSENCWLY